MEYYVTGLVPVGLGLKTTSEASRWTNSFRSHRPWHERNELEWVFKSAGPAAG